MMKEVHVAPSNIAPQLTVSVIPSKAYEESSNVLDQAWNMLFGFLPDEESFSNLTWKSLTVLLPNVDDYDSDEQRDGEYSRYKTEAKNAFASPSALAKRVGGKGFRNTSSKLTKTRRFSNQYDLDPEATDILNQIMATTRTTKISPEIDDEFNDNEEAGDTIMGDASTIPTRKTAEILAEIAQARGVVIAHRNAMTSSPTIVEEHHVPEIHIVPQAKEPSSPLGMVIEAEVF